MSHIWKDRKPFTLPDHAKPVLFLVNYAYLWRDNPLWLVGITKIDPRRDRAGAVAEANQMITAWRAAKTAQIRVARFEQSELRLAA